MSNNPFRFYKPSLLPIFLLLIGGILLLGIKQWHLPLSVFMVLSFLLWLIDKFLWDKIPFNYLFWIPDFRGRYQGKLAYEYKNDYGQNEEGQLNHIKVIDQTGSNLAIHSFTTDKNGKPSSQSTSNNVFVKRLDSNTFQITYTYENKGGENGQELPPHNGTEIVKVIKKGEEIMLSGKYYTDRHPYQSRGRFLDLKLINKELHHEF